jgi:HK97 family phage portal protein
MIIRNLVRPHNATHTPMTMQETVDLLNLSAVTSSGQSVTVANASNIHTAYRCINILSDDVAKMPLQSFISRAPGQIDRMRPSSRFENISWLLEVSPNRWMTPFTFKKAAVMWLLNYGASYIWQPPRQAGRRRELFILRSDITKAVFNKQGDLWYEISWPGEEAQYIPDVEVLSLLINSSDGITGSSVIQHARETLGRQLGAHETQGKFFAQGLNPAGILWSSSDLNKEARMKARDAVEESIGMGSQHAYRLAIIDSKFTKFEQITMKPVDAQFLESIAQNDAEIANFYGVPLYKLNMGKQSYQSNEQQNLDYLSTTLDPYLVQWEQAAALKWLSEEEQNYTYFRFNRDVLLRTDAKTRAETIERRILSGQLTPNEGRQIEDLPAYDGGDAHYIPGNMALVGNDGKLIMGGGRDEA